MTVRSAFGAGWRRRRRAKVHLENVISRFEVSDVDPLAVDVVSVGIPAAHGDALLAEVRTFVPLFDTCSYKIKVHFKILAKISAVKILIGAALSLLIRSNHV